MYELVALIVEDCDMDERGPMATGLFECQVNWIGDGDDPPPDPPDDSPRTPLPLADALGWGRAHADRVAVRIACEGHFSAGRIALPEPPLDESRQLSRRRPTGWEFLDRTDADPPIRWDVIVEVDTPSARRIAMAGTRTELGERWHDALNQPPSCQVAEMTETGADGHINTLGDERGWTMVASTPAAVLRLTAGGYEEAIQLALRAAADAAAAAGWLPAPTFSADHAFATDSHAARRNAHIDANGLVF